MSTFHIHISGIVQGVGLRPFICRLAADRGLKGWVRNGNDGVHIRIQAAENDALEFYQAILQTPPPHAVLTYHHIKELPNEHFDGFTIRESADDKEPDILITPDIAICPECRREMKAPTDRRYDHPFTTCLHCGPRYSIIKALPYDRIHTTMSHLVMCPECGTEYQDINDRRHHSQTNNCPTCSIPLHLFDRTDHEIRVDVKSMIAMLVTRISEGGIISVKGTGGYLLMADATNGEAIRLLRQRKNRSAKPFALLYRDLEMAGKDAHVRDIEHHEMISPAAPIVLCASKRTSGNGLHHELIAPGLDKIGIMLPNSPMLQLIADALERPLICTSANLSGSPIIHEDTEAVKELFRFADLVLTYERDIVVPQDDSVVQFNASGQRIILRRSRGLAPNLFPHHLGIARHDVLAMGADMKAACALHHHDKVFISQYLGDQSDLRAQESLNHTITHLCRLLNVRPATVLVDAHPGYQSTTTGQVRAESANAGLHRIQHHKAHFAAVLAEHTPLQDCPPTLGFIWDGTGYGDDGNIWGGETFLWENGHIERVAHLAYFPQLLGDKMSREPRLSALSLLRNIPEGKARLEKHFSTKEWSLYMHPAFNDGSSLRSSSMGRLLDAISVLLTGCATHRYEGEGAMLLEALARKVNKPVPGHYMLPLKKGRMDEEMLLRGVIYDLEAGVAKAAIADKVFRSLVRSIFLTAEHFGIRRLAFSGGVFQNALLTDMIRLHAPEDHELLFHVQLSPNDENICFGQLALHRYQTQKQALLDENVREGVSTEPIKL